MNDITCDVISRIFKPFSTFANFLYQTKASNNLKANQSSIKDLKMIIFYISVDCRSFFGTLRVRHCVYVIRIYILIISLTQI